MDSRDCAYTFYYCSTFTKNWYDNYSSLFSCFIFAWPTKGISIIAYIAFLFFQGYIKAKTRMHHANKIHSAKDVASGNGRLPSWAGNKDKVVEFLYSVNKLAERNGVPVLCYLV